MFSGGSGINSGLRVIIDIEPEQYILDDKVLAVNVGNCQFFLISCNF